MRSFVRHDRPDGTGLVESAFTPETAGAGGDFVLGVLIEGRDEIIRA
jgi:hypothetical protein